MIWYPFILEDWSTGAMLLAIEDQEPESPRDSAICDTAAGIGPSCWMYGLIIYCIALVLLVHEYRYWRATEMRDSSPITLEFYVSNVLMDLGVQVVVW